MTDSLNDEINILIQLIKTQPLDDDKSNLQIIITGFNNQIKSNNELEKSIENNYNTKYNSSKSIKKQANKSSKNTSAAFFVMNFFIVPLFLMTVAFVLGIILSVAEGWPLWDGFFQIGTNLTGSAQFQTSYTPTSFTGIMYDVIIAVQIIVIQSSVGTIVSIGSFLQFDELLSNSRGLVFLFIFVPIFFVLTALITGYILHLFENDISFYDGFEFMISNICGLGNPIGTVIPKEKQTIIFALFISSYTFSYLGIILGIGGSLPIFEEFINRWEDLFVYESVNEDNVVEKVNNSDKTVQIHLKDIQIVPNDPVQIDN